MTDVSDKHERLKRQWSEQYSEPPSKPEWERGRRLTEGNGEVAIHEDGSTTAAIKSDVLVNLMEAR